MLTRGTVCRHLVTLELATPPQQNLNIIDTVVAIQGEGKVQVQHALHLDTAGRQPHAEANIFQHAFVRSIVPVIGKPGPAYIGEEYAAHPKQLERMPVRKITPLQGP